MRPVGSAEALERRRHQAMQLIDEGLSPVEVAQRVGVDPTSVRRWKAAYRRRGMAALRAKPTPGRPYKLGEKGRRRLVRRLLQGAERAGFGSDLWTCPRVATLIRREFGIDYHVHHVPRLLRALGWTPQKPTHRALERDETAIQQWIRQDWPRIKKKRTA
jgi:transposase